MNIGKLKRFLKWYFNDSASVLGLRSNYYTILNTAYGSMPYMENESLLGSLKRIHEHRLIHQALAELDRSQFRHFEALYLDEYQHRYPLIIKNVFKEKTGLALCLSFDLKELSELCVKFRHKSLSPQEETTLNCLINLTNTTYTKIHKQLQYNPYIIKLG